MNILVIWLTLTACTNTDTGTVDTKVWSVYETKEAAIEAATPDPGNITPNCKTTVYEGNMTVVE